MNVCEEDFFFFSQVRDQVNKGYTVLSKMKTVFNYLQSGILL